METSRYNVITMGLAFFFIMGGYAPCQNFATTLLDMPCLPLGSICIGLLYVVMAFCSFGAPLVIARIGPKRTMCLASIAYPMFVLSASYVVTPLVVLLAILIGACAALLNIAQGALQTECCDDTNRGIHNGIFMAFNQGAGLVGNLVAIFLITHGGGGGGGGAGDQDDDIAVDQRARCAQGGADLIVLGWQPHASPFFIALAALSAAGGCLPTANPSTKGHPAATVVPAVSGHGAPPPSGTERIALASGPDSSAQGALCCVRWDVRRLARR